MFQKINAFAALIFDKEHNMGTDSVEENITLDLGAYITALTGLCWQVPP